MPAREEGRGTAAGRTGLAVEVAGLERMLELRDEWDRLAANALELNPFFERWMLAPALKAEGAGEMARFALIWHTQGQGALVRTRLAGLLPFVVGRPWKGLPVRAIQSPDHTYCSCGVPLLDGDLAGRALDAYLDWVGESKAGPKLVLFKKIPSGGGFHSLLVDTLRVRGLPHSIERRYTRALDRRTADGVERVDGHISSRTLKHVRRQKELLKEQGEVVMRRLEACGEARDWVEEFLRLEAGGWKGAAGTALDSKGEHAAFFREAAQAAYELRRLNMYGLWVGGRAVAMRVSFQAREGSYLFKIAYDEAYARYSPGTLLELERLWAGGGSTGWEDSCTAAGNQTYKRLWRYRRTMEDLAIGCGVTPGVLMMALRPAARVVKWWFGTAQRSEAENERPKGRAESQIRE